VDERCWRDVSINPASAVAATRPRSCRLSSSVPPPTTAVLAHVGADLREGPVIAAFGAQSPATVQLRVGTGQAAVGVW